MPLFPEMDEPAAKLTPSPSANLGANQEEIGRPIQASKASGDILAESPQVVSKKVLADSFQSEIESHDSLKSSDSNKFDAIASRTVSPEAEGLVYAGGLTSFPPVNRTPAESMVTQHSPTRSTRQPMQSQPNDKRPSVSHREVAGQLPNSVRITNLVFGKCNELTVRATEMIIAEPGSISPLVIAGSAGTGKTHLARGIAEAFRMRGMRRTLFLTAEQFLNDFSGSAKGNGFASFRSKYRDLDCLVIDDIHYLLGKTSTLVELRNTVDHLLDHRKQVVFTSDRGLNELTGLGAELHTRLSGGMNCRLGPVDEATRLGILRQLCAARQISITDDAVTMLASRSPGDARPLHGFVFRLLATFGPNSPPITLSQASNACGDLLRAVQPVLRLVDINQAVCQAFGLEENSLQSASKSKKYSQPRMLAMFLSRRHTHAAYSEIGKFFGNRQHSTVINAEKKVEGWVANDEAIVLRSGDATAQELLRMIENQLQVG